MGMELNSKWNEKESKWRVWCRTLEWNDSDVQQEI